VTARTRHGWHRSARGVESPRSDTRRRHRDSRERRGLRAASASPKDGMRETLQSLGIAETNSGASTGTWLDTHGPEIVSMNPSTGEPIGRVRQASAEEYETV